jgi:hypothetical protein
MGIEFMGDSGKLTVVRMAETPVKPEFHCPILRATLEKWIAKSFNLCGFGGFLRKVTNKKPGAASLRLLRESARCAVWPGF